MDPYWAAYLQISGCRLPTYSVHGPNGEIDGRQIGRSASRGNSAPVRDTRPDSLEKVPDVVNRANLRRYSIRGEDRRQELLTNLIRSHEANGELGMAGESKARQKYVRGIIRGREMGRMRAIHVSMQTGTREARRAACLEGYLDIDITNCFPNCILLLYPDRDLGDERKYSHNSPFWRRALAEYYDISIEGGNDVVMCALYGVPTPRNSISPSPHTLPIRRMALRRRAMGAQGDMHG